jgi:hypothetical protein
MAGMAATTGALSTGFGAHQHLSRIRGLPMILALCGMGACAYAGARVAPSLEGVVLAGGVIAAACGLATAYGQPHWWITLQWSVAFLMATAQPSSVYGGGALQLGNILLSWCRARRLAPSDGDEMPLAGGSGTQLRQPWSTSSHLIYAVTAGAMTSIALWIERIFNIANGYWIPMTALIILKPQMKETARRTAQRILGTLAGGVLATLLAALLRPSRPTLCLLVMIMAWCTYSVQRMSYAIFSLGVTATVVFLQAVMGLPEAAIAWRRFLATLIGASLAVTAGALLARSEPSDVPRTSVRD